MKDLGTLGAATSIAYGVNNSGQVVGFADTLDAKHAFLWEAGRAMKDLGTLRPADNWISASSINHAGVVVGNSGPLDWIEGKGTLAPLIYEHGKMRSLDGTIDPAAWPHFFAVAINDRGQIAGNGINPAGQCHALLLTPNLSPQSTAKSPVSQSPTEPATSPQPVADVPAKPTAGQSRDEQHVPTGPVKIVNRKTGLALHGDGAKRIERAGAYWKIRLGESDKFLASRAGRRNRNMRPSHPKVAISGFCMGFRIPKTP